MKRIVLVTLFALISAQMSINAQEMNMVTLAQNAYKAAPEIAGAILDGAENAVVMPFSLIKTGFQHIGVPFSYVAERCPLLGAVTCGVIACKSFRKGDELAQRHSTQDQAAIPFICGTFALFGTLVYSVEALAKYAPIAK